MAKSKDDSRRKYLTEPLARGALKGLLGSEFDIFEEVQAEGFEGDRFRLDMVCRCRTTGYILGVETKRSLLFMKEFSDAIRQAVHYRFSRIADDRLPELQGKQLPTVAVFPDWLGEHDEDDICYDREAEGMRLVGGQLRVSFFREDENRVLSLYAGQTAIWHLDKGWSANADGWLHGKRKRGALRRGDTLSD